MSIEEMASTIIRTTAEKHQLGQFTDASNRYRYLYRTPKKKRGGLTAGALQTRSPRTGKAA